MQYIYSVIEQLDLAAQQLHKASSAYSRFALLLVDNMVELMIHRQCQMAIHRDEMSSRIGRPKYDAKSRSKALGHHVDQKVKFCRSLGVIDQDEFDFILAAHEYRNELYHVGIRHEKLIFPLAWQYHSLACLLFAKLKTDGFMHEGRGFVRSDAAQEHWPEGANPLSEGGAAFEEASTSLLAAKPPLSPSFSEQVSAYAVNAVEEVDSALEFLIEDNMGGLGEEEVLYGIQFHKFIRSEAGEEALGFTDEPSFEEYHRRVAEVELGWKPQYGSRPTARWLVRAQSLSQSPSPADAVRRFVGLRDEMAPFRLTVIEAARELDEGIQLRIDAARGK